MYPKRFKTGIRQTTIPNPAVVYQDKCGATVFQGHVDDFDFKFQAANFIKIQKILKKFGTSLGPICSAEYYGSGTWTYGNLKRFVTCSTDGNLMWEKYEGKTPGGGQNYIFANGRCFKVSFFVDEATEKEQRTLLFGTDKEIEDLKLDSWIFSSKYNLTTK